jgi:sugar diacid utilization regulator
MRIDPHIRIITVCRFPREGATNPREMSGIIQSLRARYHYLIVTSFGPDIKVIFSGKDKLRMAKGLPEGFEEMLERDRLKAGVSSVFSDIRLMADQSYRSKTALELGHRLHPSKTLYPYEDYAFYHLLNRLPQGTDMLCHCHSSVLMLREYDCMHGTDLMADLRAYVRNKGNAAEAASDLHIHRNTFKYRIDKIKDIMDVDFVRNEILFEITMSLHILDYAEAPDN